jgi:hypothetical protein
MRGVKDDPVDDSASFPLVQVIGCLVGPLRNFFTIADPRLLGLGIEKDFGVAVPDRVLSEPAGKGAGRVIALSAVNASQRWPVSAAVTASA